MRVAMAVAVCVVAFAALLALLSWCVHLGGRELGAHWFAVMLMVNVAAWCGRDTSREAR